MENLTRCEKLFVKKRMPKTVANFWEALVAFLKTRNDLKFGLTENGFAEDGIFCVSSAVTEADLFSIAADNICRPIQFRHPW